MWRVSVEAGAHGVSVGEDAVKMMLILGHLKSRETDVVTDTNYAGARRPCVALSYWLVRELYTWDVTTNTDIAY
jgi:hypothetical protein